MQTIHTTHRQVGQRALPTGGFGILLGWLLALWLPLALAGLPDTLVPGAYVTDGIVNAIVIDGATTYIGGTFTRLGPATGGGVPFAAGSGAAAVTPVSSASSRLAVLWAQIPDNLTSCASRGRLDSALAVVVRKETGSR